MSNGKPNLAEVMHGETDVTPQGQGITIDIVKYDHTVSQLKAGLSMYEGFKLVTGDKKSETKLKEGLRYCRTIRPTIEKRRLKNNKVLRSAIEEHINKNNKEAEELLVLIEPVETQLKAERDKEKKRLEDLYKIETDRAEDYILHIRLEGENLDDLSLPELNARLEEFLRMDIDPAVFEGLKDSDKMEYNILARDAYNEVKRYMTSLIENMELEAKRKEQEAKEAELRKQQKEIERKEREQRDKEEELRTEQESQLKAKTKLRTDKLISIGLVFDGEQFKYKDVNVHHIELLTLNDNDFNALVNEITPIIKARKAAEESRIKQELKEQAEKEAKEKLEREQREREEREKAEAEEKAQIEALKPEKEKCLHYIDDLKLLKRPEVKNKKLNTLIERLHRGLQTIYDEIERSN